jgi:RecJ-like exonuclease
MRKDCRQCHGTGRLGDSDCDNCNGTGIAGNFRLGLAILAIVLIAELGILFYLLD